MKRKEFFSGEEVIIIKEDGSEMTGWIKASIPVNQGKDLKTHTEKTIVVVYDGLDLETTTTHTRFYLRDGHLFHSRRWKLVPARNVAPGGLKKD